MFNHVQPGQFLVNKDGEKRKILGICGEVIFVSEADYFTGLYGQYTEEEIRKNNWSLLEEPWVPKGNEMVYIVESTGKISYTPWSAWDEESRNFFLATGNYFRSLSDAELYRQKLIERMGRKE